MVNTIRPALGVVLWHPTLSKGSKGCMDYMRGLKIPIFEVRA
jgi:hypothetical protein